MILRQNNDGSVSITTDGEALKSFSLVKKMKNKDDVLKYIYYMHDPNSRYMSMLPGSREVIVNREIIKTKVDKNDPVVKDAIETYISICTDPKFQMLEAIKNKIEEYIKWWKDIKIDNSNHRIVAESLKEAPKMLNMKKQYEDEIMEQKKNRDFGGGKATLFEDE